MRLQRKSIKSPNSGAISIYLSLIFSLIISLFLTVVSVARSAVIQVMFECAVENTLCSVFGEYNKILLDEYDVLFIDLSYLSNSPDIANLEKKINDIFYENIHPEADEKMLFISDLADINGANASIEEYTIATDFLGQAFIDQSSSYIKNLVGLEDAQNILNKISIYNSYEFSSEKYEEQKEKNLEILKINKEDSWEQTKIKKDLMTWAYIDTSTMIFLGTDLFKQSKNYIDIWDTISFRKKHVGNSGIEVLETIRELDPLENVYFSEYILSKLGYYTKQNDYSELKYEIEYVIAGCESDIMNLQSVSEMVYMVRVLADYISINKAEDKKEIVEAVAEILEAFLEIPHEVTTQLVIFLWASVEAATDVSDLLDGKKVSLIKASDEINVSLEGLLNIIGSSMDSENSDNTQEETGLKFGYEDYLRAFLYIMPAEGKAYRTMDMIEHDIRKNYPGNEYFRFDACVDRIKVSFAIESGYDYRFITEKKYSYF